MKRRKVLERFGGTHKAQNSVFVSPTPRADLDPCLTNLTDGRIFRRVFFIAFCRAVIPIYFWFVVIKESASVRLYNGDAKRST